MKLVKVLLGGLVLAAAPLAALAEDMSYSYVDLAYVDTDVDGLVRRWTDSRCAARSGLRRTGSRSASTAAQSVSGVDLDSFRRRNRRALWHRRQPRPRGPRWLDRVESAPVRLTSTTTATSSTQPCAAASVMPSSSRRRALHGLQRRWRRDRAVRGWPFPLQRYLGARCRVPGRRRLLDDPRLRARELLKPAPDTSGRRHPPGRFFSPAASYRARGPSGICPVMPARPASSSSTSARRMRRRRKPCGAFSRNSCSTRASSTCRDSLAAVLHAFILPFRPARSAHAYQQVWTPAGSPLLTGTEALRERSRAAHGAQAGRPWSPWA